MRNLLFIIHTTQILNGLFIKPSNITGYWMIWHNRKYYIVVLCKVKYIIRNYLWLFGRVSELFFFLII